MAPFCEMIYLVRLIEKRKGSRKESNLIFNGSGHATRYSITKYIPRNEPRRDVWKEELRIRSRARRSITSVEEMNGGQKELTHAVCFYPFFSLFEAPFEAPPPNIIEAIDDELRPISIFCHLVAMMNHGKR